MNFGASQLIPGVRQTWRVRRWRAVVMSEACEWLSAADVLRRYREEELPAFVGTDLADVNACGIFGEHPLDVAACRGSIPEVRALLDGGAEIDAHGELGNTALHEAVGQAHTEVVRFLVARGASLTVTNDDGHTPCDVAKLRNLDEILALLTR